LSDDESNVRIRLSEQKLFSRVRKVARDGADVTSCALCVRLFVSKRLQNSMQKQTDETERCLKSKAEKHEQGTEMRFKFSCHFIHHRLLPFTTIQRCLQKTAPG